MTDLGLHNEKQALPRGIACFFVVFQSLKFNIRFYTVIAERLKKFRQINLFVIMDCSVGNADFDRFAGQGFNLFYFFVFQIVQRLLKVIFSRRH